MIAPYVRTFKTVETKTANGSTQAVVHGTGMKQLKDVNGVPVVADSIGQAKGILLSNGFSLNEIEMCDFVPVGC